MPVAGMVASCIMLCKETDAGSFGDLYELVGMVWVMFCHGISFLCVDYKHALACRPGKCSKEIVSYMSSQVKKKRISTYN